jgi:hypothetical protein
MDMLSAAYAAGAHLPHADGHDQLLAQLTLEPGAPDIEELAAVIKLGDPEGYPGLTTPALISAAARFNMRTTHPSYNYDCVVIVLQTCFNTEHENDYYTRLAPLSISLGKFMGKQAKKLGRENPQHQAWLNLVWALDASASSGAIDGPLSSWVAALARRLDSGKLNNIERSALDAAITAHNSVPRSVAAIALQPLALRLQPQKQKRVLIFPEKFGISSRA